MNIQTVRTPAKQTGPIEARCPHGSAPGACPACNGGGGGGGGGAKKASGLMGWNEAYALWKSIQVAQTRQQDYLKGTITNREQQQQEGFRLNQRLTASTLLARFVQNMLPALATFRQAALLPGRVLNQAFVAIRQSLVNTLAQATGRLIDISDKMATLLGDAKKFVDDFLQHSDAIFKRVFGQLRLAERLAQVESLLGKVLKKLAPRRVFQSLTRRAQSFLASIKRWFGKSEDLNAPE